jgi:hypothetical protein
VDLTFPLAAVVSLYVMGPILVLIHELGHAIAVVRTGRRPVVVVGETPPLISLRLRRLDLRLNPRLPLSHFHPGTPRGSLPKTYVGICRYDPVGLTVRQLRSIFSAGPHTSILAGLFFGALALLAPIGSFLFWTAALTALEALIEGFGNLAPRQHEGRLFSDGAKMMRLQRLEADFVPVDGRRHLTASAGKPETEALGA